MQKRSKTMNAYLGSLTSSGHAGMGGSRPLRAQTHTFLFRFVRITSRSFLETRERCKRSRGWQCVAIYDSLEMPCIYVGVAQLKI